MSEYNWHDEQELVDPDDSVFRLSASSVKTYANCPYQFYLSKIAGVLETKVSKGYLKLGSAVHGAIEDVLGEERWATPPRRQNQLREDLLSNFRERNPDVGDELWERGVTCLETCAKYLVKLKPDAEICDLEAEFLFGLGRPDISAQFKGYIDVVTEDGEIWDWKTGSVREKGEVIQGAVYMRGYQELYGEPPEKIRFVYLKEGKERALEPNDENWQEMIGHAKQLVQDIRREQFDPEPEGSKCYWCSREGFCHASPNGAGGIDYMRYRNRGVTF